MFSLRSKLILGITLLIVLILGSAAVLFVREKQDGLIQNAFSSTEHFVEFTSDKIGNDYRLYWKQKGFVFFNREISSLLAKTNVVEAIHIYAYDGTLLYDSSTEFQKPYTGKPRKETDELILSQIRSKFLSTRDSSGEVHFMKTSPEGVLTFVDNDGKTVDAFDTTVRVDNFVASAHDQYAILYSVSYDAFAEAMKDIRNRMITLALFGVLLGSAFALFFASRIVGSINKLVDGAAILSRGDFGARVDIKTGDELEVLGKAFNTMAEEIDKSTKLMVYKERVTKELELAAKIQTEILPKKIPNLPSLDISAGIIPAEEVGGDCYDFLEIDKDRMVFYLGDATGHGVPAGILVSVANAMFYYLSHRTELVQMMVEANSVIKAKSANNMFMTLACLEWNEAKKTLRYVNAGHEPLIIFHAKDKSVEEVRGGGMALGMLPDNSNIIKETPVRLDVGDTLVIYSDGLPECWKDEKECYGMDRLKKLVGDYGNMPSALAIRNGILSEIKQYAGGYKQMDDMTILVVKRKA